MKQRWNYFYLMLITGIILLILLGGFQIVWYGSGDAVVIINQIDLQRVRSERITKDAMILAYRPQSERIQALNELQVLLPLFEASQNGLRYGDPSLGFYLPMPDDVRLAISSSLMDYAALDTATHAILSKPNDVQNIQLQTSIVLAHHENYLQAITQVEVLSQQHITDGLFHVMLIESGLVAVLIAIKIGQGVLIYRWLKEK